MRSIAITILFALLFAALSAYTFYTVPPHIERSIEFKVGQALADNGLSELLVMVDGQDVTLAGEVADQMKVARAIELTSNTPGVRVVMSQLSITKKPATIRKAVVEDLIIAPIQSDVDEESLTDESVTN